jgi:hypothetical protein
MNLRLTPFGSFSRPVVQFSFGHTRGAQFSSEDRFRLLLCGVSHERGGLVVLFLIQLNILIGLGQQSQQALPKGLASKIPPSSYRGLQRLILRQLGPAGASGFFALC